MKLNEELLDEKNEKILAKLDNTIGLSENKEILRDIVKYHKVMQKCKCNIEFENYNIVIRNESNYNLYEELILVISELYYKNKIVKNPGIYNFERKDFRDESSTKKREKKLIKEGIILINLQNLRMDITAIRKDIEQMINEMPDKAFIIIEDNYREGEVNATLTEHFSWSIKINSISKDEKDRYIRKFLDVNNLKYNDEIVEELVDNPFYKIKNKMINLVVNCKMKGEKDVSKVLKKEEKSKKEESNKTAMQELDELVGLNEVKEQIKKVVSFVKTSKKRKKMPMLHMCFTGNPGTGKTTVARIVGKLFAEEEILSNNKKFVEAQRCDLIGKYVGHTAPKTQDVIESALGGVLFIDEAYSIASYIQDEGGRDFGAECIATLLKGMEDHRDEFCVILAGYTNEMKHMLDVNPGFASRIQFTIDFPDYSSEDLYVIFKSLCSKEKYKLTSNIKKTLLAHFELAKNQKNFANARYVRSLFEKIKFEQAYRVSNNENEDINLIKKCDIDNVLEKLNTTETKKVKIGFGL